MRPKPLQHLPEEKRTSWLRNILAIACLLLTSSSLFSQTKTVTGTVTDALNDPLIGVSVLIQGTTSGTVTDLDGNYSISVTPDNVLEFSYVGMQKQIIPVGLQTVINVVMKDDSQMLGETVVIGYGSAKKRDLTGSITNIKGEEIANKPATNHCLLCKERLPVCRLSITDVPVMILKYVSAERILSTATNLCIS